jgi:hypothetical protein
MLNDVNKCSAKMEYIDILYEAKKKMEDLWE